MIKCYFCYKPINMNKTFGIYLRQGNEDYQLLKSFVCQSCDRSLGDDDIREEIKEILLNRAVTMRAVIMDLKRNKVKGFENLKD